MYEPLYRLSYYLELHVVVAKNKVKFKLVKIFKNEI